MSTESFYRFKLGAFECIVVSDGFFAYPHPAQIFFVNAPQKDLARALGEHDLDPEEWQEYVSPYSCLLINTGQHRVLVDTGAGDMAPTAGKLLPNLRAAGVAPEEIDTVILTHGHPDHTGGNIDSEGKLAFPKARYVMWKAEWEFWTSEPDLSYLTNEHIKQLILMGAHRYLPPIQDRLDLVNHETEIVPGIPAAIPTTASQMGVITVDNAVLVEETDQFERETASTTSRIATIFAGIGKAVIPVLADNLGSMVDMWLKQRTAIYKANYDRGSKRMNQTITCRVKGRGGGLRIQRRQQSGKRKKQRLGGKNAW